MIRTLLVSFFILALLTSSLALGPKKTMGNENFLGKRDITEVNLSIQEDGPYFVGETYTLKATVVDDTLTDTKLYVTFDDGSDVVTIPHITGLEFSVPISFATPGSKSVVSVEGDVTETITTVNFDGITVYDLTESSVDVNPTTAKAGEEVTFTLSVLDGTGSPVTDPDILNSIDVAYTGVPDSTEAAQVSGSTIVFKVTYNTVGTYTATFEYDDGTTQITLTSEEIEVVHDEFSVEESNWTIVKGKAIIGEGIHVRVTDAKDKFGNDFTDPIPATDFTINTDNKPGVEYDTENNYFVVPTTGVSPGVNVNLLAGGEIIGQVSLYEAVTATGSDIPYVPVDVATELFTVTPSSGYEFQISIDGAASVAATLTGDKITYTFEDTDVSLDEKEISLVYSIAGEDDYRPVDGTSSITITRIYGEATNLVVKSSTNVAGSGPYTATVDAQITFVLQVVDNAGPIPHGGSISPDYDDSVSPVDDDDDLTFTFTHKVSTVAGTTYTHAFVYPSVTPLSIVISTVAGPADKVEVDSDATSYESLEEFSITVLLTDQFGNELDSTGADYEVKVIRGSTPEDPTSINAGTVNPTTKEVTFTLTIENPGTGLSIQATHTGSSKIGTLNGVIITKTLTTVTVTPTLNFVAGQPDVTLTVKAENDHGSIFELDGSEVTFSGSTTDLSFTFVDFDSGVAIFEVQSEVASIDSTTVTVEVTIGEEKKSDSIDITVTEGTPQLNLAKVSGDGEVVSNKLTIGIGATVEVSFGLKNQYNFNLPLSAGQTVVIDSIDGTLTVDDESLESDGTYQITLTAVGEVGSDDYDVFIKQGETTVHTFSITIELVAGLPTRILDTSVSSALTASDSESGEITVTFGDAVNNVVPLTDANLVTIVTDLEYEKDLDPEGKLVITFWTTVAGSYSMQITISSDSEVLNLNILPDEYDPSSTEVTTYLATLGEESFVALSYYDQFGNSIDPPDNDELDVYVVAFDEENETIEESRVDAEADSVSSGKRLYKFTIDSVENAAFYGLVVEYDSDRLHELILTVADTPGTIPETIEGNVVIDDEKNIGGPVNIKGSLTFTPSSNTVIESSDLFEDDFSLFNVDTSGSLVLDGGFEISLSQEQFNQLKSTMRAPQSFSLTAGDGEIIVEDSFSLSVASLECDGAEAEIDDSDPNNIIVTITYQEVEGCAAPQPEDDGGDEDGEEEDDDGGLEGGAIAGIAIAAVLGALVIGVIVFLVVKRKCGGKSSSAPTRSYEAETRKQRDDETEEDSEEDTEEDSEEEDSDEEDSEEEDSEEEDSEEDSEEEDSEEGSEEDSEEGSDESSEEGSDEGSDESSEEGSDEGSDESSEEGSDESSEEGSDEGSDESSEEGSDESSEGSDESSSDEESS